MKKTLVLLTLAMMGFGGYIGYSTNYTNTATANEVIIPRFVDVPRTNGFNLDINLNKNTVTCNSTEQDVNIKIERKDSIIYRTRVVTKEVVKHVKSYNMPPMRDYRKPDVSELCAVKPNSKHKLQLEGSLCNNRDRIVEADNMAKTILE